MKIYINGDSFVDGTELGDHVLTNHPGYLNYDSSFEENYAAKEWYAKTLDENKDEYRERQTKLSLIQEQQELLRFSHILEKITNIPTINNAIGGISFDHITRMTITDLHELSKKNNDLIAIIGLTEPSRIELPYKLQLSYDKHNQFQSNWKNYMIQNDFEPAEHYEELVNHILEFNRVYNTEYHVQTTLYKNLLLIKNFCEIKNIRLLFLKPFEIMHPIATKNPKDDLIALQELVNLKFDIEMNLIAQKLKNNVYCPGRHVSPIVHVKVAEHIANLI